MGKEQRMWELVRDHLAPFGKFKRIENSVELGMPDVLYLLKSPRPWSRDYGVETFRVFTGLLELKQGQWPARATTPLAIDSLTREQVLWHEDWEAGGGSVATLARIGDDYLWLAPANLRAIFKRQLFRADCERFILGSGKFPTTAVLKRMMS